MTFTSALVLISVLACENIVASTAIGVSSIIEAYASAKDARRRERRLKQHGSGKVELKKRLQHSLKLVSQIGAGSQ